MRPRGWLSRWVKVRPWYYTERSSLASRSRADADAIEADWRAVGSDLQEAIDSYRGGPDCLACPHSVVAHSVYAPHMCETTGCQYWGYASASHNDGSGV